MKFKRIKAMEFSDDANETKRLPSFTRFSQLVIQQFGITMQGTSNQFCIPMTKKPSPIHQSSVTRVVKGAVAGGFRVTSLRVDKDGTIVLSSGSEVREAREEPRLPIDLNEWDEVLKK